MNVIVKLASDFGEWLYKKSRKKSNVIILVVLSFFSPLGFVFASSLIAYAYRKGKNKR
ncbi:MAG: hypothetical protein HYS80_01555 [Candidatus Aenigmarchaeota archaeon]|nr:hypothetical protein [Candidatus Aenigmarchaeota archaeon]